VHILRKGPFKYYVIKEVGGWGGRMMIFDDKVGGWGWLNDDVIKKYTRKKLCLRAQKKKFGIFLRNFFYVVTFFKSIFFCLILALFIKEKKNI
jgi:hypothetical protein